MIRRLDPIEAAIDELVAQAAFRCRSGARVLDAGSGEGRFSTRFAHADYVAVDLAVGNIQWDYSRLSARADLTELPFRAQVFEAILCIVVLEHTREPARVLQEFGRVLASGGHVYLVVPLLWEVHQAPHDYFRFTAHGIRWLAETAGLEIEEIRPLGGLFWVLSRRSLALLAFCARGIRWPVFVILAPLLGLALPLLFYWLDRFDKTREYTLAYRVVLRKSSRQSPVASRQS